MFLFPNKGHVVYLPDAGKGSAVCSSLHCGTRYLIAVLARPTAQVPRWAGNVSGGPGSIPGQFWRTGVPSFRRCSAQPLHSGSVKYRDVVRPLHRPLHYRVRGWGRLKKRNLTESRTFFAGSLSFISYVYICTWMKGNLKETVLGSNVTWP